MRKLFLSVLVLGALSACKKETKTAENKTDKTDSAAVPAKPTVATNTSNLKEFTPAQVSDHLKNKDNEKYFTEMKYYFGEEKVKIVSEYTESEMKWEIFMKVVFTDEYCFLFTIPYQGLCVNIEALNKNEIDELRLIIKSNIDENIITYL